MSASGPTCSDAARPGLANRIKTPTYDPAGVVLALDRTNWVGFSMTSIQRAEGYAFSEMTGVLAGY